ncbi:MAG: 50S ribosomal protein L31e [Candidatus Bathyarchaeota archaeon]|nr:50S ribosomal protein L31e [Candidatus Bathyarchaeota archaeon]
METQAKEEKLPKEDSAETTSIKENEPLLETIEKEIEVEEETKTESDTSAEKEEATSRKKKEKDEDIVEEKTYTIPLAKALIMPPRKRAPRAIRMIKAYIRKHMKVPLRAEEEDEEAPKIMLTNQLNECIWGRGIEKPPRKIRVRATKDKDGNVTVHLAEVS